jgi:hypothetical protein
MDSLSLTSSDNTPLFADSRVLIDRFVSQWKQFYPTYPKKKGFEILYRSNVS